MRPAAASRGGVAVRCVLGRRRDQRRPVANAGSCGLTGGNGDPDGALPHTHTHRQRYTIPHTLHNAGVRPDRSTYGNITAYAVYVTRGATHDDASRNGVYVPYG